MPNRLGFALFAVLLAAQGQLLAGVLIVGAPPDPTWLDDVQAKIVGTGLVSGGVDTFNAAAGTPTLAQLQTYNSILVFSDTNFADTTSLGDNLADYVDGGGGVVQMTFSFWTSGIDLGGRWRADGYDVWAPGGQDQPGGLTLGTIYDAGHPILQGVTSFDGGSSSYYNTVGALNTGAVAIADWSNGAPLIAANITSFLGRVVGLNFYPPSSDVRSDFWVSSTDGDLLMANALNYVAGQASAVPEPVSLVIWSLGAGAVLLSVAARRRRVR